MHNLMKLVFAMGVFVAIDAGAADQVCVGGAHMNPTDVDSRILAERGTALWYVEQSARACDGEECGEFQATAAYLELAYQQDGQLIRYAFSGPVAGRPSVRPHIETGGFFELFRKYVHVGTRQPDGQMSDNVRIGKLGYRVLKECRTRAPGARTEYQLDIWEVKMGDASYAVSNDLSMGCLRY